MKKLSLSMQILLALVLGVVVGLLLQGHLEFVNTFIKPVGTLFLRLMQMIIIPLVFFTIIVGTCGIGDAKSFGRIGGKTIVFYMATTAIAVTIGLLLGNLFSVGKGIDLKAEGEFVASEAPNLTDTLLNIVPTNPFAAISEGNMLQIITFALFIGAGIVMAGAKAKAVQDFFESFVEIMYKITGVIMKLAPIAVFALIIPVVVANGAEILGPLLGLIGIVYLGCFIHAMVTYNISLLLLAKMNPIKFYKEMIKPIAFAFSTASSSATLPFSLEATGNLGVPAKIRSFVLPLGATINMDGTSLYQGACALFIATAYGIDLTLGQQATIVLTAVLASIGTAGVPGAGMIMLSMVLQSVGLPVEGVALIVGVDRVLDMARTTVNILGDATCSVVVAASEKELNFQKKITTFV